jgi:NYN domain
MGNTSAKEAAATTDTRTLTVLPGGGFPGNAPFYVRPPKEQAPAKEARYAENGSIENGVADVLYSAAESLEARPSTTPRSPNAPARDEPRETTRQTTSATVFWDYENCCVPKGMRGYDVTRKIREFVAAKHLQLKGMNAIGNPAQIPVRLRQELNESGMIMQEVVSKKDSAGTIKSDTADIAILTEIMRLIHFQRPPHCIMLIRYQIIDSVATETSAKCFPFLSKYTMMLFLFTPLWFVKQCCIV